MTALAIDIGASKIEYALVSAAKKKAAAVGRVEIRKDIDTDTLLGVIRILVKAAHMRTNTICLSVPGFVVRGKIIRMPNLPRVDGKRFASGLRARRIKAYAENDVKCMALAQWAARGKKADDDFLLIAPGSGIGGAIVRMGKLVRGAHNTAGEIGHMKVMSGPGSKAHSAHWSDWEELCSGFGIEERWQRQEKAKKGATAKEIFTLAKKDKAADRIVREGADAFGCGMAGLANIFDPREIIIAGSVGRAYMEDKRLLKLVRAAYAREAIEPVKKMKIMLSKSKHLALEGAALLACAKTDKRIDRFASD